MPEPLDQSTAPTPETPKPNAGSGKPMPSDGTSPPPGQENAIPVPPSIHLPSGIGPVASQSNPTPQAPQVDVPAPPVETPITSPIHPEPVQTSEAIHFPGASTDAPVPTPTTPTTPTVPAIQPSPRPSFIEKYIPTLAKLLRGFKKKEAHELQENVEIMRHSTKRSFWDTLSLWLVSKNDRLLFLDELTTLISSDIRLVDGIRLLKQQTRKKSFKKLLTWMIHDIEGGNQLSDSMTKYSHVFPRMWVQLIKAGESSGQLASILRELNEQQTAQQKLMGNIKGALVYPGFIIMMLIVLMVIMMTTIVPQIEGIYSQARVDLPQATRIVIWISRFTVDNGIYMVIAAIALVTLFISAIRKVYLIGKLWDKLNLRWPIFGGLNRLRNLILFADNIQLLLQSGILLTDALAIVADIVPSVNYREEILRIRSRVNEGENMSKTMGIIDPAHEKFETNFYFPLEFAQMIHVGEQTGNTNKVLNKVKETYSNKVHNTVKNLSTLIEPIMIIIVGLVVLGFLLAIMMPFFGLGKVARGL